VDDKLRILSAVKQAWGTRVTTVFPRQGQFALDPAVVSSYPAADITVERISDLLSYDLPNFLPGHQPGNNKKLQPSTSQLTVN
jgi:hypothetical protein